MVMLGIDFGTSSTVAIVGLDDGRAVPLLFGETPLLLSAVCATPGGELLVGRDAVRASRARPDAFEPYPKSRIDDGEVLLGDRAVPVAELIGAVLRRVHDEAVRVAGAPVDRLILTHPAGWGARRRQTLLEAATIATLPPAALVAEPVAAAAYYVHVLGHAVPPGGCMVVYDFGAGTFDASVVRRTAEGFDVLSEEGLLDAGGLDIDAVIVAHLGATYGARDPDGWRRLTSPAISTDRRISRTFWDDVRAGKEELSRTSMTTVFVPILELDATLGREQLEHLARLLLDRTIAATRLAVRNAGIRAEEVTAVFLVGGSSRMSLPATLLHRSLGIAPTVIEQPELIVAGGTLHADGAEPRTKGPSSRSEEPESVPPAAWTVATAEHSAPPAPAHTPISPVVVSPAPVSPVPNLRDTAEPDGHSEQGGEVELAADQRVQAATQTQVSEALELAESAAASAETPPADKGQPDTTVEVVPSAVPARRTRRRLLAVAASTVAMIVGGVVVAIALQSGPPAANPTHATSSSSAPMPLTIRPTPLATLTDQKEYAWVAFTSDGRTMATPGSDKKTVTLWDLTDPAVPTRLATFTEKEAPYSAAFSSDGKTMAIGSAQAVTVWDTGNPATPTRLATLTDPKGWVSSVAFSSDRKIMAAGVEDSFTAVVDDNTVMVWDVANPATPTRLATLTDHKASVASVAFSPDGKTMATGSRDGQVILWDMANPATPTRLATFTEQGGVSSATFSPLDGKTLVVSGGAVTLWNVTDPATPTRHATLTAHGEGVDSVAFSPDGKTLATGGDDNTVMLWNVADPATPTRLAVLPNHNATVRSVAFSPNGKTMASAGWDGTVIVWQLTPPG